MDLGWQSAPRCSLAQRYFVSGTALSHGSALLVGERTACVGIVGLEASPVNPSSAGTRLSSAGAGLVAKATQVTKTPSRRTGAMVSYLAKASAGQQTESRE